MQNACGYATEVLTRCLLLTSVLAPGLGAILSLASGSSLFLFAGAALMAIAGALALGLLGWRLVRSEGGLRRALLGDF